MFLHIDIDAFFVSAEQRRDKRLKAKPVAVGGRSNTEIFSKTHRCTRVQRENDGAFVTPVFENDRARNFSDYFCDDDGRRRRVRGIVTTASYEARRYGIKTGMTIAEALRLCPQLIVIPGDLAYYHRLSHALHRFLQHEIPAVEQYSIDEFFADPSGWVEPRDIYRFALKLQYAIKYRYDLPVSIGIAPSKWIAKLATEYAKPFGILKVDDIDAFIATIPIEKFPGIGRRLARRLRGYGIGTLGELRANYPLLARWKKPGILLYKRVGGEDGEGIAPKKEKKSLGISRTFDPIDDASELLRRMLILARYLTLLSFRAKLTPSSYAMSIKYKEGFRLKAKGRFTRGFWEAEFKRVLAVQMRQIGAYYFRGAIKIALRIGDFIEQKPYTFSLFALEEAQKQRAITETLCRLRERYGPDIVKSAAEL